MSGRARSIIRQVLVSKTSSINQIQRQLKMNEGKPVELASLFYTDFFKIGFLSCSCQFDWFFGHGPNRHQTFFPTRTSQGLFKYNSALVKEMFHSESRVKFVEREGHKIEKSQDPIEDSITYTAR